jgi:hypothetical protein
VSVVRWRGGRHGRARTLVVVGVLLAGGALSACSGQPGAAAVVDGTAISVADVQTATSELTPLYQGVTPTAVLQVLIDEKTVSAFASAQGVGVSPAQAADELAAIAAQASLTGKRTYSAGTLAVERYLLATKALQGLASSATVLPELQQEIAAEKVQVSTRFGVLGEGNTITEATHPWIVAQKAG